MNKSQLQRSAWRSICVFSVFLTLALFAGTSLAQTETGQITGKVTDPGGAIVSGAMISIKSVDTGREISATSNEDGTYTVAALQPGLYDVKVEAGSFKPSTKRVQITVGSKVKDDTQLALSEVSGTVYLTAGGGVEIKT